MFLKNFFNYSVYIITDVIIINPFYSLQMQRDLKTGHLSQTAYTQQAVEILTALKKLGEQVNYLLQTISSILKL